jgi:hypothetical protein
MKLFTAGRGVFQHTLTGGFPMHPILVNELNNNYYYFKMSIRKKQKKSLFSKWRKKGKIADGLSTTFFELKLNSASQIPERLPLKQEQEPAIEECKEPVNDRIKLEVPLHLLNVIV